MMVQCPLLREFSTEIIRTASESGAVPFEQKEGRAILVHQRSPTPDDDRQILISILLESVTRYVFD